MTVSSTGAFFHVQVWRSGSMRSSPRSKTSFWASFAVPLSFGHLGVLACRQQPPAVLEEDGHERRDVPLVPGAIVNGELGYRGHGHRATVPARRRHARASVGRQRAIHGRSGTIR